jgi:hypothetical protein
VIIHRASGGIRDRVNYGEDWWILILFSFVFCEVFLSLANNKISSH